MKGYHRRAFVLIQGVVQRDRADHLKGFESIEHVTPLDPLDVTLRLEQMAALKDGWLDGKGKAPDKEKLTWLADQFDAQFDGDLPLPYLYPTAEGGIQAEWTMNGREVSLEINLETKQAEYQALNLKDDSCSEFTFALDNRDGWSSLNEALKQLDTQTVDENQVDSETLFLRQIHPTFVQNGRPTSQAFRPTPKDENQLSVYNGENDYRCRILALLQRDPQP